MELLEQDLQQYDRGPARHVDRHPLDIVDRLPAQEQDTADLGTGGDRDTRHHTEPGDSLVLDDGDQTRVRRAGSQFPSAFGRHVEQDLMTPLEGPVQKPPAQRRSIEKLDE